MSTGTIQVYSYTADEGFAVPNASITLSRTMPDGTLYTHHYQTDSSGFSSPVTVDTPPKELSLEESNTEIPYSTYNLTATANGYEPIYLGGIQAFAEQNSLINLAFLPHLDTSANAEAASFRALPDTATIPAHQLYANTGAPFSRAPLAPCAPSGSTFVLNQVVIPTYVTVHLGTPASSAQNVTVSFRNYIKNVASSEIYPTWPKQSLIANIYCQISLALNRIYTEWYPSKGYNFTITNSTSYDQYYVHNRNIFDSISAVVDEVFDTYIRKTGTVNPYYSEYCDGKTVSCKGLKQWGTVDLANSGYSAINILKYYYGTDIELVTSTNIQSIEQSYGGTPLKIGSTGEPVRVIQRQLNRIAKNYPSLGTQTVDGVFGTTTDAVVKKFQKQFSLTQVGAHLRQIFSQVLHNFHFFATLFSSASTQQNNHFMY
ncbi:MAG: peptidoglycan-binding protein [Oscillospiraceae bacterium]|nr:peptidoglycan-binding protein [Oscillospiraceae bacterium]